MFQALRMCSSASMYWFVSVFPFQSLLANQAKWWNLNLTSIQLTHHCICRLSAAVPTLMPAQTRLPMKMPAPTNLLWRVHCCRLVYKGLQAVPSALGNFAGPTVPNKEKKNWMQWLLSNSEWLFFCSLIKAMSVMKVPASPLTTLIHPEQSLQFATFSIAICCWLVVPLIFWLNQKKILPSLAKKIKPPTST
jgi:hypothetical protein